MRFLGRRREVGLAVVYAIGRGYHFNIEGVKLAVERSWREGEAVFVGDEIGDFAVGALEVGGILREIDAAAGGVG